MSTICFIYLKKLSLYFAPISLTLFINTAQAENAPTCNIANGATENTATTATTPHLTDNNDGTIIDPESGLIWKKCSEGQTWSTAGNNCTGTADMYTWQDALQRVLSVNTGTGENFSQTDWRLPNIKELASIAELRCSDPAINNTVFPDAENSFYWSSSAFAPGSNFVWGIVFYNGSMGAVVKFSNEFVRLVRSGQ